MKPVFKKCPTCNGTGRVNVLDENYSQPKTFNTECNRCNGSGKIETEYFIEE